VNASVDLYSSDVPSTEYRETINSTGKVAVSFKIIMTRSVTRSCFTRHHQTCKTKTTVYKTKADFLVSDQSCPKTDGLRPHHWSLSILSTCKLSQSHAHTGIQWC